MRYRRISTDKLKQIRNYLPQGSNKIISKKTGYTPIYISKVLHGVNFNSLVIEEALKIALVEKTKAVELNEIFDNILNLSETCQKNQ
jgi:predicted metallopeptidase